MRLDKGREAERLESVRWHDTLPHLLATQPADVGDRAMIALTAAYHAVPGVNRDR